MRRDDLVVLCPDIQWEATLEAILSRHQSLGLKRQLRARVLRSPGKTDGWLRLNGAKLLQLQRDQFHKAMLIFDHQGCGDDRRCTEIEAELERELSRDWGEDARSIVVEPELESWLIGGHSHFNQVEGLAGVSARGWLREKGVLERCRREAGRAQGGD